MYNNCPNHLNIIARLTWIALIVFACQHVSSVALAQSPVRPVVRIMTAQPVSEATDWPATFAASQQWSQQSGIDIEYIFLPTAITNYMSKSMETIMTSSNPSVDIFHLDVVWVGDYANYLLPLNDRISPAVLSAHNEQNIEAGMALGQLVAVPQAADFGVLFTRTDILSKYGFARPPQTWTEMEAMLAAIVPNERKSNPSFIGYIGQLSQYEGMVCNVLEWLKSEAAGSILEPNRTLSLLNPHLPNAQRAHALASRWRQWVQNGWVAMDHDEMSALREWKRGNALFHRNWPFVGAQTRASGVSWSWAMTKLPGAEVGMSGAALGGWMWGVSKATRNPEAAIRVLEWLMSPAFQKVRTLSYGSLPTIKSLYDDSDVCSVIGDCNLFRDMKIAHRPSGAAGKEYQNVSITIYNSWYSILAGAQTPARALAHMNQEIADLLNIDILGPPRNVEMTQAIPIVFAILSAAEFICILFAVIGMVWLRRQPSIRRAGLTYLVAVLVALAMLLVYLLLHIGIPTTPVCTARSLLMPIAAVVLFGSLGLRNGQLYRLSGNLFAPSKGLAPITIARYIAPLVLVLAALWIMLAILSPLTPSDIRLSSWRYIGCSSADTQLQNLVYSISFWTVIMVFALASWISFKARNVGVGFSESRGIGIALANAFLVTCAVMPVIDLNLTDQTTQFALRATAIILSTSLFLVADMFPRLLRALQEPQTGPVTKAVHFSFSATALKSFVASIPGLQTLAKNGEISSRHSSVSASNGQPTGNEGRAMTEPPATASPERQSPKHAPSSASVVSHSQQLRRIIKRAIEMDESNPGLAVDLGFAREAVVSVRSTARKWLLKTAPWTVARLYLLPREGLLMYHHVVIGGSLKGRVFSVNELLSVEAVVSKHRGATNGAGSNAMFSLAFPDLHLQVMTANPDECTKWVDKINWTMKKAATKRRS